MLWRRSFPADVTVAGAQVNLLTFVNLNAVTPALAPAHFAGGIEDLAKQNSAAAIRLNA
jgi:hypothetical protein